MKKNAARDLKKLVGYKNNIPYEELITVRYPEEELEYLKNALSSCEKMDLAFYYLRDSYPFECVRETERVAYVLFQGTDGSLLCAFFDKEKYFIYQVEQFHDFYSIKDFEGIKPGVTTKKELEAIYGELATHCPRVSSVHLFNRIVREGTLLIYFQMQGFCWAENPPVGKMVFFVDGEKAPESFESVPAMLPMDKHTAQN
jgi:hypothetical protein